MQIRAPPGSIWGTPGLTAKTTKAKTAEDIPEDVGEIHRGPIGDAAGPLYTCMTKSIISCTFVFIREHSVSFVDLLELFLRT